MDAERIVLWLTRFGLTMIVLFAGGSTGVSAPVSLAQTARPSLDVQLGIWKTGQWVSGYEGVDQIQARIQVWRERGVRFKGAWQPEEIALTLDVLDAFAARVGEDRLSVLIEAAVRAGSFGFKRHLTVIRKASWGLPAAVWYALRGQIVLNDSLFDAQFVYEHYSWSFLGGPYVDLPREVAIQEAIIGHEIGHVLIDGIHAEARAMDEDDLSLERLYDQITPSAYQPHAGYVTNENLATEFAVWALKIGRPEEVDVFWTRLGPRLGEGVAALP
jgi:hypothetical protein